MHASGPVREEEGDVHSGM
jgi:hypothetical protein